MGFNDTDIRWTDKNHNAVHGCSKSGSPGCANCYAERVSRKFGHTDKPWIAEHAEENVTIKRSHLNDTLRQPAWVFVNSMSDMFHDQIPDDFIGEYWDLCREHPKSVFQVLTKHGADAGRDIPHPPDNVMVGVSVGHPDWRYRIDWLRDQPVATRFVSFEPLVKRIPEVDLAGIDWAIIGGESGPDYRDMDPDWARELITKCWEQGIAVFFKQHADRHTEQRQTIRYPNSDNDSVRIEEFPRMPNGALPKPRKHR